MNSSAIEAVIFDLGRVVIDFDHMIAARRIAQHTTFSAEQIYNLFFDSEVTGLLEEGKIAPVDFFSQVKAKLGLAITYAEFLPIWNEIFFLTDKNREVYKIAKSLMPHYTTVVVSNVNALHFAYVQETFPVFDVFTHIVASCEIGYRKPHPRIYQKALEKIGLPAERVFYTDDRPELIEGARVLGIQGYVFTGVETLKQDLASVGVRLEHS